ncbi:NAC domain containing protein 50-like, partial [Bidens hawaiensis]|uniref:NAC domain containing protein 50-like n=1 Tax=Bidens hawaiensis TaxID=980011 RepID=UPI0040491199
DQELERARIAQDAFVLCRIFQKSGLGPPNGDRYAPFLEEEWQDDGAHFVPGGAAEDDVATNGDGTRSDIVQIDAQTIPFVCKRERSEDHETFSLFNNGSEDSTTSENPITTNMSSALVEFPLLEPVSAKESQPLTTLPSFDASTLEKSVPPGYLKFISNLENEILNVSMEKETLKIEVMRAQAMISILQSRVDCLTKENDELRKGG